jgi:PUA domain protein
MRSYTLSKKETHRALESMRRWLPPEITSKTKSIRIIEIDEERSILIGEDFTAAKLGEDVIIPFLKMDTFLETLGKIFVDKGAVKYVCNGANVMRPGVVRCEGSFKLGDMVAVKEAEHGKTLAVGTALIDSTEVQGMSKGLVVKNLHYVGDIFWETYKKTESP